MQQKERFRQDVKQILKIVRGVYRVLIPSKLVQVNLLYCLAQPFFVVIFVKICLSSFINIWIQLEKPSLKQPHILVFRTWMKYFDLIFLRIKYLHFMLSLLYKRICLLKIALYEKHFDSKPFVVFKQKNPENRWYY